MSLNRSVTILLGQLRADDQALRDRAAAELVQRYTPDLMQAIGKNLHPRLQARVGSDDILQNLFLSFFRRQQAGQFELENRDDLLRLLMTMAPNKVRSSARREGAQRRSFDREQPIVADDDGTAPLEALGDGAAPPDELAEMAEEMERRLGTLPEDLRQIALWKLEGFEHEEIARQLDRTVRTVERKVQLIRDYWSATSA